MYRGMRGDRLGGNPPISRACKFCSCSWAPHSRLYIYMAKWVARAGPAYQPEPGQLDDTAAYHVFFEINLLSSSFGP